MFRQRITCYLAFLDKEYSRCDQLHRYMPIETTYTLITYILFSIKTIFDKHTLKQIHVTCLYFGGIVSFVFCIKVYEDISAAAYGFPRLGSLTSFNLNKIWSLLLHTTHTTNTIWKRLSKKGNCFEHDRIQAKWHHSGWLSIVHSS